MDDSRRLPREAGRDAAAGRQRSSYGAGRAAALEVARELRAGDRAARHPHAGHGRLRGRAAAARGAARQGADPDRADRAGASRSTATASRLAGIRRAPDEAAGPRCAARSCSRPLVPGGRRKGQVAAKRGRARCKPRRLPRRGGEEESRKPLYSRPVMRRRGLPFQARIVRPDARGRPARAADRFPAAARRADRGLRASPHRRGPGRRLGRLRGRRAQGDRRAAALDREPAGGAARRRLRDPRAARPQGRRARRHRARGEPARRDAALAALRGDGILRAPQQGAGGDRRRGVRLRRRGADPPREPRRGRAAAAAPGRADGPVGRGSRVRRPARRAAGVERVAHFPGPRRPLADHARGLPRGGPAVPAAGRHGSLARRCATRSAAPGGG